MQLGSGTSNPVNGTPATPTSAPVATPAAAAAPAKTVKTAKPAKIESTLTFQQSLSAEMARIAKHATKIETLKNGATLYTLAGGREVEQAPGMRPYVVKQGQWPPPKATTTPATSATPPKATTTTPSTTAPAPATTTPSGTTGSTTSGG